MDTRENRVFAQFQKVCQNVWLSSKSMPVYITLKKCSTQYVAHFMWLTKSLKIGEYATICSTLYVLPAPMQLGTILCKFGLIFVTRNGLEQLELNWCNYLSAKTPFWIYHAKILTGMCKDLLWVQWWLIKVHSQSHSGKRLLLASRDHPIRSLLLCGRLLP